MLYLDLLVPPRSGARSLNQGWLVPGEGLIAHRSRRGVHHMPRPSRGLMVMTWELTRCLSPRLHQMTQCQILGN